MGFVPFLWLLVRKFSASPTRWFRGKWTMWSAIKFVRLMTEANFFLSVESLWSHGAQLLFLRDWSSESYLLMHPILDRSFLPNNKAVCNWYLSWEFFLGHPEVNRWFGKACHGFDLFKSDKLFCSQEPVRRSFDLVTGWELVKSNCQTSCQTFLSWWCLRFVWLTELTFCVILVSLIGTSVS